MDSIEVIPAYGAVYNTIKDVTAAWEGNKDFQIGRGGQYVNKADAERYNVSDVTIRYGKRLEKVVWFKVQ